MRTILFGLILLFALALPSHAKRVALVIGNSTYQHAGELANPKNDARDISAAFAGLGYTVEVLIDADLKAMQSALGQFSTIATGADVALVYYSGHGIEIRGQNYLLPVDAKLAEAADAPNQAVPLDAVMSVAFASGKFGMIVLDACRDNPLADSLRARDASVRRGLAPVSVPGDQLVAFAAKAGTVAQDGPPGGNSPFTVAFLNSLRVPRLDVRILLRNVLTDVLRATETQQSPFTYGTLQRGEIFLNPGSTSP
jgi:uncharacterized caspase-like protein